MYLSNPQDQSEGLSIFTALHSNLLQDSLVHLKVELC